MYRPVSHIWEPMGLIPSYIDNEKCPSAESFPQREGPSLGDQGEFGIQVVDPHLDSKRKKCRRNILPGF
jgi:hypothetical protein